MFSLKKGLQQYQNIIIKIITEMGRGSKKIVNKCTQHQFSLKPKSEHLANSQHFNVSFCTDNLQNNHKKHPSSHKTLCLNAPLFNKDNNYATPTFILSSQKAYYLDHGAEMKKQHEKKMIEYTDEKISLNIPKPRSKTNYCSVCRQNYDDYLEHIESQVHKKKIHQSSFNRDIINLTQMFNHVQIKNSKNIQQKMFSVTRIDDSEDDVQIISNPYKKIKQNQNIGNEDNQTHNIMQAHNYPRFSPYGDIVQGNSFNYFKPFYSLYQEQYPYFNLNMNFLVNPYQFSSPLQYQQLYSIMPNSQYMPNMQPYPLIQNNQNCGKNENMNGEMQNKITCIVIDDD